MKINLKKGLFALSFALFVGCVATLGNYDTALAESNETNLRASGKLVNGSFTEYYQKSGTSLVSVGSQYERGNLDFESSNKVAPYPGLDMTKPFQVQKTGYIKAPGTGNYRFFVKTTNNGQVYVNDELVAAGTFVRFQKGDIIKVKVVSTFPGTPNIVAGTLSLYSTLYWATPASLSAGGSQVNQLVPKEIVYTTPDMQGVDTDFEETLVHGVYAEYETRSKVVLNAYDPFASQYEDSTLDFSCLVGKQPYPELDPVQGFRVKKTAYVKIEESGNYRFNTSNNAKLYVNDNLIQNNVTTMYLEEGQVVKLKVISNGFGGSNGTRYFYDVYWMTPESLYRYVLIPKERLYTTPDLNGVPLD